ncbi:MAG: phospholipid carrier-dependent glycosyltransferase, partial [Marinicaulis sp.]|nr:phospholipid carrier-dependent glycosyltransferase [Marinicaulis sp.]
MFLSIAGGIIALRILTLLVSNTDLGPDESQYWFWSRTFEFGYFSKPPLIAWAIAATTSIFGNDEWAVRLSAPLFHLGAAVFIYLSARSLFEEQSAFWAGLLWLVLPGVTLSSFVIATDAPLLFFWSVSLFAFLQIANRIENGLPIFLLLGAGLGLGLMSKYAMIYFLLAGLLTVVFEKSIRSEFATWKTAVSLLVAMALVFPNVIWNANNNFQTVLHTADNANWGAELLQIDALALFLGSQFAVAGFILVVFILMLANSGVRRQMLGSPYMRALFIFALTPLLFVSGQAFISRAHANWAACAYPAIVILASWALVEMRRVGLLKSIFIAHLFIFFSASVALSNLSIADRLGLSEAVRQIRGWDEQAAIIGMLGAESDAIVIDDRSLMGAMLY